MRLATSLILLLALTSSTAAAPPQDADGLGHMETRGLVELYGKTKHWALKAIVLLSLGKDWHPEGADMILDALKGKNP